MNKESFKKGELFFTILIGLILGVRMFSMLIVAPFISNFTESLTYGSLALGGVALGVFAFTQGVFQLPFGAWSDRFGNKKMILIGLAVLVLGFILAIFSNNAYVFIISRALQGSGAIIASGYAWISQKVSVEKRADAISIIGLMVGLLTATGVGGGSILREFLSVRELYVISVVVVVLIWFLAFFFLKSDKEEIKQRNLNNRNRQSSKAETKIYLKSIMKDKLFIGILVMSFFYALIAFTGYYFIIPQYLDKITGQGGMWVILVPSIVISVILMRVSTRFLKKGFGKELIIIAAICLLLGSIILFKGNSIILLGISATIIMTGYNILFSLIPTVANNICEDKFKGTVNGIVNFFTFLGCFLGTTISGLLWSNNPLIVVLILIISGVIITIFSLIAIPSLRYNKNK